jgi:hypothetical protein
MASITAPGSMAQLFSLKTISSAPEGDGEERLGHRKDSGHRRGARPARRRRVSGRVWVPGVPGRCRPPACGPGFAA